MTKQWAVVILDRQSAYPTERQQDLAKIGGVDMQGSTFHPNTSPKPSSSRLKLSFPIATPDLYIREMMQVWAGWRDDTTNVWSDTDPNGVPSPVYGGYITRIEAETVYGGEKRIDCTLTDYTMLLSRTDVKGWPTFQEFIPVSDLGVGQGDGHTVEEWLTGMAASSGYDGVVRQFLGNGMRYDGVDPIFSTIVINNDTLPGILDAIPSVGLIKGYFGGGGCTVDAVVRVLADCALFTYEKNYIGPELIVSYWVEAAIGSDDTRIVPKFRFANTADIISTPDFIVAADADETIGEVSMLHPHKHERDAADVRTGIVVFGAGGDTSVPTPPIPLIWNEYSNPDHTQIYPTDYQTETPWWGGGPLFDKRIHTQATALSLAQFIESRVWGAKGSIEFYISRPVTAGQRIQVRDPNEAIDQVYIVTDVEGPDENSLYKVRVGFTQMTVDDVMRGGLVDVVLFQEDLFFEEQGGLHARSFWPGQARPSPLDTQPQHQHQNHITPADRTVPGMVLQGSWFNPAPGLEAVGTITSDVFRILPPQNRNSTPTQPFPDPGTWATHADGRPHPNVLHIGGYTADGTYPITIAVYRLHITRVDLKGPGLVSIYKNGGPSTGGTIMFGPKRALDDSSYTYATDFYLEPTVRAAVPVAPDDLHVVVSTTDVSVPTFVTIWEEWKQPLV